MVMCLERETQDPKNLGKIKLTVSSQIEVPKIPTAVVNSMAKKAIQKFFEDFKKFYIKNHKNL